MVAVAKTLLIFGMLVTLRYGAVGGTMEMEESQDTCVHTPTSVAAAASTCPAAPAPPARPAATNPLAPTPPRTARRAPQTDIAPAQAATAPARAPCARVAGHLRRAPQAVPQSYAAAASMFPAAAAPPARPAATNPPALILPRAARRALQANIDPALEAPARQLPMLQRVQRLLVLTGSISMGRHLNIKLSTVIHIRTGMKSTRHLDHISCNLRSPLPWSLPRIQLYLTVTA
jgi:hypothetical protein